MPNNKRKCIASSSTTANVTIDTPADTYELLTVIGEGTFSVVHKARRKSDHELVAVKRLKKLEQAANRIKQEVACLRSLSGCDNIVSIIDCHKADDVIDIIMPYFEHDDFAVALQAGRFSPAHTR